MQIVDNENAIFSKEEFYLLVDDENSVPLGFATCASLLKFSQNWSVHICSLAVFTTSIKSNFSFTAASEAFFPLWGLWKS